MKNLFKKLFFLSLTLVAVCATLVGCNLTGGGGGGDVEEFEELSLADYKAYILKDFNDAVANVGTSVSTEVAAAVQAAQTEGIAAINAATSVSTVKAACETAKANVASKIPAANGILSYTGETLEEKTKILGLLEAYAVRNNMTGLSLFENAGYQIYNERVVLGTETYIIGYGFGTLAEGHLTSELATENNPAWKMYYHTVNSQDPGTMNYLDNDGSEVGDIYSYSAGQFYTTFMNEEKNGYDWVPELAKEFPQAVNPQSNGTATTWRFAVRTGNDGLKYTTNSEIDSRAAFNNRSVELEDYVTSFKLLLTQANGLFRGAELANTTAINGIKGAKAYYEASADGPADFSGVGVKVYEEDGTEYFEVEFMGALTSFYAMYYINSVLYMPVPQAFLDLVGVENYLGFNENKTESPLDNSLALGAYALERWDSQQQIVWKKNPNYVYADTHYEIAGIHMNILTAAQTDTEAVIKEFEAGKIDASGIPLTKLDQYRNDPRTRQTRGTSVFKLNVNATDDATWEGFFGVNGSIDQSEPDQYWTTNPALGNEHFVKALSLSINRSAFAAARGSVASVDFLAPNYMSDPENGIAYADTDEHKAAIKGLLEGTDGYGYNLELAREYFRVALAELESEGAYTPGTAARPTTIELEIGWMYPSHETNYHNEIKQFFEDAFNHPSVSNGRYKLTVNFWVGATWDEIYDRMQAGRFDIGFGSISGNPLNPLDFMSTVSTTPSVSGGWTLNFGIDSNNINADYIVYDGVRWTFDALWMAANAGAVVVDGANVPAYSTEVVSHEANQDGSYTTVTEITIAIPEKISMTISEVVVCWYGGAYKEESVMDSTVVVNENGTITITTTTSKDLVDAYPGRAGFDFYYDISLDGAESDGYISIYVNFPVAE